MHWLRNIPSFALEFRLWVPDLPGMGESSLPSEPWTPRGVAEILDDGLALLIGEAALVSMVGFSFGGLIAGHWAASRPSRIERLIAVAPAGTGLAVPPSASMRSWRQVSDPFQRSEIHRHNLRAWMLHEAGSADDVAVWIAQQSVESDRLRNREVSTTDSLLEAMREVRCPAHAIYGAEDVLYKRCRVQVQRTLEAAGFVSVNWLSRAGHWVMFEQAEAFDALASALLSNRRLC
jgi:pimeloyl-ACP methyl ester carboxylesterase